MIPIVSFNLGKNKNLEAFKASQKLNNPGAVQTEQALNDSYTIAEMKTAEILITSGVAVCCLQNIRSTDRSLIRTLAKNFEIISLAGTEVGYPINSAIALDKNRFDKIENHSIAVSTTGSPNSYQDFAIAKAVEKKSGKQFTFVSAFITKFDFTKELNPDGAAEENFYCDSIMKQLSKIDKSAIQIIAGDMNATPELLNSRFNMFQKNDFQLHRANQPTRVASDFKTEVDYFFTKIPSSIALRIKSLFLSTFATNVSAVSIDKINFGLNNMSDHKPICIDLEIVETASKISQIWKSVCSFLFSRFGLQTK